MGPITRRLNETGASPGCHGNGQLAPAGSKGVEQPVEQWLGRPDSERLGAGAGKGIRASAGGSAKARNGWKAAGRRGAG